VKLQTDFCFDFDGSSFDDCGFETPLLQRVYRGLMKMRVAFLDDNISETSLRVHHNIWKNRALNVAGKSSFG
jgi:hypothetical protein